MLRRRDKLDLLWLLGLCGCFSTSLLQEPRPLPPGNVRVALGAEAGYDVGTPTFGLRVGVAERTELRAKLALSGGEAGVNVQALDSKVFDLMLMPSFFAYDLSSVLDEDNGGSHLIGFGLPLVVSASLDDRDQYQLFVAPDLRVGKHNAAAWSAVGFHFGAAISGPRDYGTLIPECAWMIGTSSSTPDSSRREAGWEILAQGSSTFSCALGVSLGARHTAR